LILKIPQNLKPLSVEYSIELILYKEMILLVGVSAQMLLSQ
jgi:hypothetical protein